MRKNIDLERYTLKLKTVRDYSKFLNLPIVETKLLLLEQNVTPSLINKERYIELKKKGMKYLADYYHTSVSTLYKISAQQKLNKVDIPRNELLKFAYQGYSVIQLAEKFGVSYATMNKLAKKLSIPIKANYNNAVDKKAIYRLLELGLSHTEISKRLKCTVSIVRYYAQRSVA